MRDLDRLVAIQQLRTWLDDQQLQAITGARLTGCSWPDIGQAVGVTTQEVRAQWGTLIGRYEAAGLLAPDAPTCAKQDMEPRRSPMIGQAELTLSVPEAAKLLGISRAHTYELVARNELPAVRLGRRLLIPRRVIQALLRQGGSAA